MFYKFNLYSDLFCFHIMFAMINEGILSIDSSSFSKKSNHKNNQNRNLLPINKNYCTASKNQKKGEPSNLISSIIHQMQENADGQLSCISIFANYDSFSEGKKFENIFILFILNRRKYSKFVEFYHHSTNLYFFYISFPEAILRDQKYNDGGKKFDR